MDHWERKETASVCGFIYSGEGTGEGKVHLYLIVHIVENLTHALCAYSFGISSCKTRVKIESFLRSHFRHWKLGEGNYVRPRAKGGEIEIAKYKYFQIRFNAIELLHLYSWISMLKMFNFLLLLSFILTTGVEKTSSLGHMFSYWYLSNEVLQQLSNSNPAINKFCSNKSNSL